jgi:hypothetical protein
VNGKSPLPSDSAKAKDEISRTALHLSAQRSPGSKAASSMLSVSTSKRSARPAQMALFTMRRSLTNWLRAFTRRAGSRSSRACTCGTPVAAISAGEQLASLCRERRRARRDLQHRAAWDFTLSDPVRDDPALSAPVATGRPCVSNRSPTMPASSASPGRGEPLP